MTPPPEVESASPGGGADEPQVKGWERFFKKYYREQINEAVLGFPKKRSVIINYFDVDKHDPNLAEQLLHQPMQTLFHAEEALKLVDVIELTNPTRPKLHVRIENLPQTHTIDVRDLRAEHLGKFIAIKGLVKRVTEVRPKLQDAVYQCGRCGAFIKQKQEEHLVLQEPLECYEDQGGCGRESTFKLIITESRGLASRFIDTQKVEMQEAPENMRGGEQPQRMFGYADDDLCGMLRPGERITINGVLRANVKKDHGVKSTIFEIFVDVNSIEKHEQEFEEIETTEEEEAQIRLFARDPEVYHKLRDSIAPTLHGLKVEKLALLLQLFGGVEKIMRDKSRLRGDIHVLLVGDPGVAKSQLIRYMSTLAPRGIYTSGKSSSGAGLTAAAVKDDFGDGRWTLEAGAMVLADRGLLCVDEIDKMDKNDQSSMHEGMEQQSISVAKAGITATLQSRCSVLGAANPKAGRFEDIESTPIADQINFPPALLSRFDVIFVLRDLPDATRDEALARFILNNHTGGAMLEQLRRDESDITEEEVEEFLARNAPPPIDKEFLRKYVAYAKRSCHPVLTEPARAKLVEYFVDMRRQGQNAEVRTVPITARQLEALVRLAEASARVRLSKSVDERDAEQATQIYEYYMRQVTGKTNGPLDVDNVAANRNASQRDQVNTIKEVIRLLQAGEARGARIDSVVAECVGRGMMEDRVRTHIDALRRGGQVMFPHGDDWVRLV